MKRIFTLLSACTLAVAANSQTYLSDDFEGGSLTGNNAWTIQTVVGGGTYDWFWDNFSGDNFAEAAAYDGANDVDYETWLISPVLDLNTLSATNPTLTFSTQGNYFEAMAPELEVWVSTVYAGGAINMGDWTEITGFNLSTGSFNEVLSGDLDFTTYASATTFYFAFRYQSSATNGGGTYQVDDVLLQEGPTVVPTLTIDTIQYTLSDPADSPYEGMQVTTSGVVSALTLSGADSGEGYFIQDADGSWSGLMIVDGTNTPSVGDSVEVTGTIEENFDFTRMVSLTSFTNLGAAGWTPTPAVISSNDSYTLEEYESVMVTVEDAECTNDNAGFGLWEANDGSGKCVMDDDCFDNSATLGDWYDITGPISYSFSEYKINPRTGADIVMVGSASIVANELQVDIYPNPAENNVVVNTGADAIVAIYSMTGALVGNGVSNMTMDVSDLEAGMYQVVITANGSTMTQKLMIK